MRSYFMAQPDSEPVTLDEAKRHARIFVDDDQAEDDSISALIVAAREKLESKVSRAFVSRSVEAYFPSFPTCDGGRIRLPRPPLASVESITYVDHDGVIQTIDPADYAVSVGTPGTVRPAPGKGWPTSIGGFDSAVKITYTAGYGDPSAVPAVAKLCIKILVAHWYDRREPIVTGTIVAGIPFTVDALADALRWGGGEFPR